MRPEGEYKTNPWFSIMMVVSEEEWEAELDKCMKKWLRACKHSRTEQTVEEPAS